MDMGNLISRVEEAAASCEPALRCESVDKLVELAERTASNSPRKRRARMADYLEVWKTGKSRLA